jgi:hypothetical protein
MQPVLVSAEGALEASESELCPSSSQLSGRPRLLTATPTSSTTRADKPTESAFWSCRISPEREYDDSNDRRPPVIAAAASRTSPSTRVRPVHDPSAIMFRDQRTPCDPRHYRIECEEALLGLGGQRCGALLGFRLLRHDTEYTESAMDRQRQHSRAIGF